MDFHYNYTHRFKVIVVGDRYVGKTSLALRFIEDSFIEMPNLGATYKTKKLNIDEKTVRLDIWDWDGDSERFPYRRDDRRFYRNVSGAIAVYDVTNADSFCRVQMLLREIILHLMPGLPRILVGNKDDNPEKKAVTSEDALRVAEELGADLYETSAKNGINVSQAFEAIAKLVLEREKVRQQEEKAENKIRVDKTNQNDKETRQRCF